MEVLKMNEFLNEQFATVNTYTFKVTSTYFPETFEGETTAKNIDSAINDVLDWYEYELGTDRKNLSIEIKIKSK
jgi:hypothetical protein